MDATFLCAIPSLDNFFQLFFSLHLFYSFSRKSVPDNISSSSKVRDNDLSSKQGSLCTVKIILTRKYYYVYLYVYVHIFIFVIKLNIKWIFSCAIDRYVNRLWDHFCGNCWIDRYFRILHGTWSWRLRYTFLKYPVYNHFPVTFANVWDKYEHCEPICEHSLQNLFESSYFFIFKKK